MLSNKYFIFSGLFIIMLSTIWFISLFIRKNENITLDK